MESYALNLWDYPWKTEFHTITMFSGFFKIKIENKICQPEDLLLLLGYKRVVHCFQMLQMPLRSDVGRVAFDLFVASFECLEMERVANAVKPIGIASRVVFEVRQEVTGDGRVCADHVRERHRQAKAGMGKNATTANYRTGEVGPGGAGGKGEGAEEEPREIVEGGAEGRRPEGGGRGDGEGKGAQANNGQSQSNLRGIGGGGGEGDNEASFSRSNPAGSRAFQADPKSTAAGSHGNQMRTESWRSTPHPEVENVYDAVEDLSSYGFPSADKSKLGTIRATTRKEKKDVVPPKVTGPALWAQPTTTTMEESNLSFSTFRQERSRSGAEFKDSASKKNSYHTIESGRLDRPESRDRSGSQRTPSEVMTLRVRGVRVKGQGGEFGPEAETLTSPGFGAELAAIHHHQHQQHLHGYVGSEDDPVATLLNLDPEHMKDPVTRRQVLAQLEPSIRQNAPPPPPPPGGSARGPSACRPGFTVYTSSPYQPWQFQASSDLPRPPVCVYKDPSQTLTTSGRPSSCLTAAKTRDPWKSDDLGHDETWQCGSCSYENRPQDDACHVCNTSRYL